MFASLSIVKMKKIEYPLLKHRVFLFNSDICVCICLLVYIHGILYALTLY